MCVCVCVLCFVLRGCVCVYGGVHIYINVYTNKTYIYKRYLNIYIYIYKLCKGMCFPRFTPGDRVWGRWCALVCIQASHCREWEALCTVCDRDSFQGMISCPGSSVAGGGCTCWRRLCISRSWIKHPLLLCGALLCPRGNTNTVSSPKWTQNYLPDMGLFLLPPLLLQREYTSKT